MILTCPKCSYVRKPTDTTPAWQCPACGIAYAKFKPNDLRGLPEQVIEDTGLINEVVQPDNPKEKKYRSTYALAAVASIGLVLLSLTVLPKKQIDSPPLANKEQPAEANNTTSTQKKSTSSVNTNEKITLAGAPLDDPMAITRTIEECNRANPQADELTCKPFQVPGGQIKIFFPNFDYAGITSKATYTFSGSGKIDYVVIQLPWDQRVVSLANALVEKYGKNGDGVNDSYIDPSYSDDTRIPGAIVGWRDAEGNELLMMTPTNPQKFIHDLEIQGKPGLVVEVAKASLYPKIYIHSAELVGRVGGRVAEAKGGDFEKRRNEQRIMKDRI